MSKKKKISGKVTTAHSACYTLSIKHQNHSSCFLHSFSLVSQKKNHPTTRDLQLFCQSLLPQIIFEPVGCSQVWQIGRGLKRDYIPTRCVKIMETQSSALTELTSALCLTLLRTSGVPIRPQARAALWIREQLGKCLHTSSDNAHRKKT